MNWLWAILSHTFDSTGKSEMRLLFLACSASPSLGIGVTSAIFQVLGKVSETKELLMIIVIVGRIAGKQSFITRMVILSIPGALFDGIELMILSTCLFSTALNKNCSDTGKILGEKRDSSKL